MSINKLNEKKGKFEASGWVEKKATGTFMGITNWQRRYLQLEDDKLFMFESDKVKDLE